MCEARRMLAYKFRSSTQIPFALDIILKRRLYCAEWHSLNDVAEGTIATSSPLERHEEFGAHAEAVQKITKKLRVCSLSLTFDSHLLWAHYASSWDGLALELEIPDSSPEVHEVEYGGFMCVVDPDSHTASEDAIRVLSNKHFEWKYEREVRIITSAEWFTLESPVSRVIAGSRMNPATLEAIQIICAAKDITLCRTGIGDEGIDADYLRPLAMA